MAGAFRGQVPGREFLDHMADGDRLAPVLSRALGAGALARVDAAGKVVQGGPGLLAGRRQGQCRILAQHHADRLRLARQTPHDVKRDHTAFGDPDPETAQGGIPYG